MRKGGYTLHMTDENLVLYRNGETLCTLGTSFEENRPTLEAHLKNKPALCFIIDQDFQNIFDEKLPPLWPWDRSLLLFHKRAGMASRGGYAGFQLFNVKRDSYLRSAHIPLHSPLMVWMEWVKLYGGQVHIGALEGWRFLKKHHQSSKAYQMLIYPLSSGKKRHLVFREKQVLLCRVAPAEEDPQTSLHFLSRSYPDINDALDIAHLISPLVFLQFIETQKRSVLPLCALKPVRTKHVFMTVVVSLGLSWTGLLLYQGIALQEKTQGLFAEMTTLQTKKKTLSSPGENVPSRAAIEGYQRLVAEDKDPLQDIQDISVLLEEQDIYLEKLELHYGHGLDMTVDFLMEAETKSDLSDRFEDFLEACHASFPTARLEVIQAPFHSSPHETFNLDEEGLPLASVRIIVP